ncbi:hypothetical protein MHU86_9170 [Fragilaria crotonensis]|nr:hypothetical protein MHU86_9170 [Fragilaria crotonensis]
MNQLGDGFGPSAAPRLFYPDADEGTLPYQHQNHYDGAEFYDQARAIQGEHFGGTQYGAVCQAEYVGWDAAGISQISDPGYYFPLPHLTPAIYSAPVSAIAYDSHSAAMYVASHTQPFGNRPTRPLCWSPTTLWMGPSTRRVPGTQKLKQRLCNQSTERSTMAAAR